MAGKLEVTAIEAMEEAASDETCVDETCVTTGAGGCFSRPFEGVPVAGDEAAGSV